MMYRKLSIVLVMAVLASTGLAQKTWVGPTHGGDWAVATNWSGSAVPADGESVSLSGAVTVRLSSATAWLSDFVMTNATVLVTNWNSHLRATNVTIQSGGRILAAGPFATSDAPSRISILCTNLSILQGGLISADAAGYKTGQGPASGGLANRSQGGGYGGRGGAGDAAFYKTNWITYGSASMPTNPGSGGCTTNWGGAGGGVIWIEASGTASVYGILTSMGGAGLYTNAGAIYGSGGSGGSIYLSCGTFTGGTSGLVRVNGGAGASGNPGRGGGGRIAVAYAQAPSPWPLVRFTAALGATGCSPSPGYLGQWGTLWFPDTAALATNLLAPVFADVQVIPGSATSLALDAWTVISNTFRLPATNFLLTVAGNMTVGTNAAVGFGNADVGGDLVLTNNGMLRIQASPTNGVAPDYGARLGVTGVLAVGSAASLQLVCDETTGGGPLVQAGRFTVANKGMIDADGAGFKNAKGPGGGAAGERTEGGGYGGAGGRGTYAGTNDGFSYGSPSGPAQCGSGGGGDVDNTQYGGFGGGLIRLETTGSVHVAGTLTANGGTIALLNTAGGSGGGIFITCGAFSGATSGIVRANGASSSGSGGRGGGGRICLNYASASWPGPRFLTSPGSAGAASTYPFVGQPGTLYLSDWSGVSEVNDGDRFLDTVLYVSNQNALTLNTLTVSNCALVFGAPDFILTVSNALVIATNGSVRANRILCDSLLLTNNASLTVTALPTNGSSVAEYGGLLAVTNGLAVNRAAWIYTVSDATNGGSVRIAAQTARIAAGGGISAAARGYMGTRGQGGGSIGSRRAGGGYGGRGGRSDTVTSAETTGATNGSPISPLGPGSGGCYSGFGGYGGGAIRLEVDGVLTLDGTLTAAGGDASYAGSGYPGGGAGGGILALCNTLVGGSTASVLAPGGNTATSGGGGGGRICMAVGLSPENRALLLANQVPPSMTLYGAHGGFTGALSANPGTGHPHTGVNTIYLAQTGTYTFLSAGSYVLTIKGSPANYGSPVPHSYGAVIDIPADAWVTNSVTTPADESNGLRRACLGWTLTLTNGSPVDAGTGAEAVFQLTNDLHLTWRWTNEWRLIVTNGPNGAVNAGDYLPWYTNGIGITGILATVAGGYVFDRWLGEVPAGLETNNPIAVEMNQARTLEAIFAVPGGTTRTWAGNGRWQDHTNWSPAGMPGREDAAILSSGTVSVAEPFDCASLSVNGGAVLVFTNWDNRLAVAGAVTVASGAVVKVVAPYADAGPSNRLWLSCASLTIESNGLVMADGAGFTPGQGVTHAGVDASYRGGGGGHGGRGGYGSGVSAVSGAAYDSLEQPALAGGGGANLYGACGGGVIRLEVSGTATVRGTISANGAAATSNSGGGAGGAVWLSCATLAGETSGVIRANGGAGSANGGGGGGGRIAIHGQLAAAPQVRLQTARGNGYGQISYAEGQLDYISPAYGTVYVTDPGWVTPLMDGARFVDVTLFVSGTTAWAADRLVITNCSLFMGAPGFAITATNGIQIDGAAARLGVWNLSTEGDCRLTNGAQLRLFAEPTNGASPSAGGSLNVAGVLAISPGSWVLPQSDATNGGGIRCTAGSVEVATNAGVNATGKGFRYGSGPGYGRTGGYGGGGGYGGTGGSGSSGAGGPSNGWAAVPERSGSGGGAGAAGYGGGLIWVETAGEVQLDGTLVTDGSASWTSGGGGSGGGVLLACRRLLLGSSAQILARGGASGTPTAGGGGSGGRVAVWQNMTPAQRAAALADPAGVASSARLEITDAFSGFESQMNVTNGLGYTNAVVGTVRFLVGHPIAGVLILVR